MTAPFQLTGCRLSGSRLLSGPPNTYDRLYALAGQVPAFDLRFDRGSIVDVIGGITPTFTRPSSVQTVWTGAGFTDFAADVPAFAVDPVTGRTGYVHNPAATNLFLNSASPATQSFTVTAQAYTLSFYGTGTITLSGASTAGPLVGTGAAPNRVQLTFTPSAGTLTLTLSGSIVRPQLETGTAPTSPITTAGSAVTRAADTMTVSGVPFSSFYNQLGGTWYTEAMIPTAPSGIPNRSVFSVHDGTSNNRYSQRIQIAGSGSTGVFVRSGASVIADLQEGGRLVAGQRMKMATRLASNNFAVSWDGNAPLDDTAGALGGTMTTFAVGNIEGPAEWLNGVIYRLAYFPPGTAQSRLQQLTV